MVEVSNRDTPLPIPNGWFAVAFSKDLVAGEVKRVFCFGEELVLFRTRSGEARLLDAYCAHLGAHLAEGGKVFGEAIRCPFHQWKYDGDGRCVEIPYSKTGKIPSRAKLRSWHVVERNHLILAWHHAEGEPPDWEVPQIEHLSDPGVSGISDWTEPRFFTLEVDAHMQEMAENNCDPVHFLYVHNTSGLAESAVEYAADGRFFRATSEATRETPIGKFDITLVRDTWGLGMSAVFIDGIPGAGLYMFSSTSPVDQKKSISRWVFSVTRNMVDVAGEEWIDNMSSGVLEDMRIWENKIYRPDPVLCDADEFISDFRRWCAQFYSGPPADPGAGS